MSLRPFAALTAAALLALLVAWPAVAASESPKERDARLAEQDRIRALERKVDLLTEELARTRQDMALPEEKGELESVFGMGPGASKIYGITRGLSLGGYAEGVYTAVVADKGRSGDTNRIDFARAVLYAGYKFTDRILFNSELEFEHASTEEDGAVSVEFAALDFLIRDEVNARAGLLLVPMGFLNEIHEPPFYYGTHRPDVERVLVPSTWRENGAGLFGRVGDVLEYKLYAIASLDAGSFSSEGIREGRQQGSEALAEDLAFVGRLDLRPVPEILAGGSVFVGNTGQDQTFDIFPVGATDGVDDVAFPDARLVLWEVHAQLRTHGLHARGLFTMAHLADAGSFSRALGPTAAGGTGSLAAGEAVAEQMLGGYGEVAYEVLQWLAPSSGWSVEPFVRVEHLDTQHRLPRGFSGDRRRRLEVYTVGLQLKPIPNVVLKLDYRNRTARGGALGDEVNLGVGVVF